MKMKINYQSVYQKNKAFIGFFLICFLVMLNSSNFATTSNLTIVLRQVSVNALIAFGLTFVILSGGIDLSVGSVLALSSAVAALALQASLPAPVAVCLALLVGLLCGAFNGFFVAYAGLQPFITTLVSMTTLRGLTLVSTGGKPLTLPNNSFFYFIGNGHILGLSFPIILMAFIFIISWFLLTQTRFGRYTYAIGGNEEATRLAGINVKLNKMAIYMVSGFTASLAGLIITSRLSSAGPSAGTGFELDAIAVVVVGGTSLAGGSGFIQGTLWGALIIGVLGNALNLLNISAYFQMMIKGLVILLAVLLDKNFVKDFVVFCKNKLIRRK